MSHNAVHDHKDSLNYTGLLASVVQARFQTLNCIIHYPKWSSQLLIRINSTWQKIFSKRKGAGKKPALNKQKEQ